VAMPRTLITTISDEFYCGLPLQIGCGEIRRFIEGLVRPRIVATEDLENDYQSAADDVEAEREAQIWLETGLDEAIEYVQIEGTKEVETVESFNGLLICNARARVPSIEREPEFARFLDFLAEDALTHPGNVVAPDELLEDIAELIEGVESL